MHVTQAGHFKTERLGLSAADTDAPQAERVILFFSREQDIEAVTRPSLKKQCFGCLPGCPRTSSTGTPPEGTRRMTE
jgi:hypothetical protein